MLIPKRKNKDLKEADVEAIIKDGTIDFDKLDQIIPIGVENTFQPALRVQYGFKYNWTQAEDKKKWHVHGHQPDPAAPAGSNSSNGWVVRIKCGNKWLLEAKNYPETGDPSMWSRNEGLAGMTHVPATSETLKTGRRNSMSIAPVETPAPYVRPALARRGSFS